LLQIVEKFPCYYHGEQNFAAWVESMYGALSYFTTGIYYLTPWRHKPPANLCKTWYNFHGTQVSRPLAGSRHRAPPKYAARIDANATRSSRLCEPCRFPTARYGAQF
jgi:hypothetical protein